MYAVLLCEIIVSINKKRNTVIVEWFMVMLGELGWVVRMLECSARVISIVCAHDGHLPFRNCI